MNGLRQTASRLGAFFRQRKLEAEMAEEMRAHLELRIERNLAAGMAPEEARCAAQRSFGNLASVQERARDERDFRWLEDLWRDLGFAVRSLRKSPGLTAVVVLSLALGIGANTALFSLFRALVLQPLSLPDAGRLVDIVHSPVERMEFNRHQPYRRFCGGGDFMEMKAQSRSFEDMTAHTAPYKTVWFGRSNSVMRAPDAREGEAIGSARAFANFFSVLRIQPFLGRGFRPEDDELSSPPVAVLSYDFWQRRFAGRRDILGQSLMIGKAGDELTGFTVVGILPCEFDLFDHVQVWLSQPLRELKSTDFGYSGQTAGVIARLRPGVTLEQAQREMEVITQRIRQQNPEKFGKPWAVAVVPIQAVMAHATRRHLLVVFALAAFVLLIACANVANLLLMRAATRERELAIRAAAGADRGRLLRQLLTESLVLAGLGGALGLVVAVAGLKLFQAFVPFALYSTNYRCGLPWDTIGLDPSVLGFTGFVTLATGMFFGTWPALRASRPDLNRALKDGAATATAAPRIRRLTGLLVGGQVALAVVLVGAAGLFTNSLWKVMRTPLGYEPRDLLMLELDLTPRSRFAERTEGTPPTVRPEWRARPERDGFVRDLERRLGSVPGTNSVGVRQRSVWGGDYFTTRSARENVMNTAGRSGHHANTLRIAPGWLRTMGMPLLQGRDFTAQDTAGSPPVAIVSAAFVSRYLPDANPIGRRLYERYGGACEIVGVVPDSYVDFHTPTNGPEDAAESGYPMVFLPLAQGDGTSLEIMVRTFPGARVSEGALRAAVHELDPVQVIRSVRAMEELGDEARAEPRFYAAIAGCFAVVAALLAAIGIYAMLAFSVARRTHEIGVRVALGAGRREILALVLRQGMRLALAGIAAGLAVALFATKALASLLWGVQPTDPLSFGCVTLLLTGVALLACYIPARRAAKVDPMVALRCE
jgi:predicted permease